MKYFIHLLDASVRSSEVFGRVVDKGRLMRGEGESVEAYQYQIRTLECLIIGP